MAAILPFVHYLKKKKFPNILAVLIPYLILIICIVLLLVALIPFVISQIEALAKSFPEYLNRSANVFGFTIDPKQIESGLSGEISTLGKNAFAVTTKVFGGFFSVITIFIVSFYLLMYHESFKRVFAQMFQPHSREAVLETIDRVNYKLGAWLRGQVVLSLFIGCMSWIALTIIGIPFALPLALLAGMLEVVPTLGPTLSAIPAVIVAFTISPATAITVVVTYILIQAIEGHILVPNVMQKAVGLNPVVVIIGIMIGANLMGIPGALLAIPFISFAMVIFKSVEEYRAK